MPRKDLLGMILGHACQKARNCVYFNLFVMYEGCAQYLGDLERVKITVVEAVREAHQEQNDTLGDLTEAWTKMMQKSCSTPPHSPSNYRKTVCRFVACL